MRGSLRIINGARYTPSMRPLATAAIPVDENDVPILGAATAVGAR